VSVPVVPVADAAAGARRIGLNAMSLLGAYVLPRLFSVIAVVVAARVLGAERFGAYGTAGAYAVILSIAATLGLQPLLVRDIARSPARAAELLRAAHVVKAASALFMLTTLVLLVGPLGYGREVVAAAVLLGVSYAIGSFAENLAAYVQAVERMHVWTESSAIAGLVTGVLGALLVWTTSSVVWFCAAPIAGQLAALAWLAARVPAEVRAGTSVRRDDVVRMLRALAPFAAAFVILTLYYKVDVLLLAHWRGTVDVGIYTAGHKFFDVAHALAIVAAAAVYPRLSRDTAHTAATARWSGTRATEILLLGATLAAGVLWILRALIVRLLFGDAYADAVPVLGWLAIAMPALAVNIAGRYVLGTATRMDRVALLYAGALLLSIVLNARWAPVLGPLGTARAHAVAESVLALGMLHALRVYAAALPGVRTLTAVAAAALLAPVAAALPDPTGIASAALYIVAVLAVYTGTGAVSARDRTVLRSALSPRAGP
jgi:O-antigen/teichoic acid export membrane protein